MAENIVNPQENVNPENVVTEEDVVAGAEEYEYEYIEIPEGEELPEDANMSILKFRPMSRCRIFPRRKSLRTCCGRRKTGGECCHGTCRGCFRFCKFCKPEEVL